MWSRDPKNYIGEKRFEFGQVSTESVRKLLL